MAFDRMLPGSTFTEPQAKMARDVTDLVATGERAPDELLSLAAEILCRTVADICVIALLSHDRKWLHPLGFGSNDTELLAQLNAEVRLTWDSSARLAKPALETGEPSIYRPPELAHAVRNESWVKEFVDTWRVRNVMVIAMRAPAEQLGVMAIARRDGSPPFSDQDIAPLQDVADRLALAVANLHLKEEIERLRHPERNALPDPRLRELTPRELEILKLIGDGLTSREIGERLFLSSRTIEWHRGRLTAKLDEHQRSDLIALGRTLRD